MSWTDKLKRVTLSNFCSVQCDYLNPDDILGGISCSMPPGYFISDEGMAKAFDIAAMYNDLYMSAECECNDGVTCSKSGYLFGVLNLHCDDGAGSSSVHRVPLIISCDDAVTKGNNKYICSCRGLFAGKAMVVKAGEDFNHTLIHETMHALIAAFPELKDVMYGDSATSQMEEIAVHTITDHLSKLMTLAGLELKTETVTGVTKRDSEWGSGGSFSRVYPIDICYNGKSLVFSRFKVSASDAKSITQYIKQKKEVYQL